MARVETLVMIRTELRAHESIVVGGREILIVESISCAAASIDGRLTGTALREPVAIVVRSPEGDRAFDLEGREIRIPR